MAINSVSLASRASRVSGDKASLSRSSGLTKIIERVELPSSSVIISKLISSISCLIGYKSESSVIPSKKPPKSGISSSGNSSAGVSSLVFSGLSGNSSPSAAKAVVGMKNDRTSSKTINFLISFIFILLRFFGDEHKNAEIKHIKNSPSATGLPLHLL